MHPYQHAAEHPDRIAFAVEDLGQTLTYKELDKRSNQVAHLFRQQGLKPGDRAAAMLKNCIEFPIVYWGAQRSGIFITLLSTHLKPEEAAYILNDSQSQLLISSSDVGETPRQLTAQPDIVPCLRTFFDISANPIPGSLSFYQALAEFPTTPIADETAGYHLQYSSGTTGRPKGIAHKFTPGPIEQLGVADGNTSLYEAFDPLVTFSAGPAYHGAPLNSMLLTHRLGGSYITLQKFDAEATLRAIDKHKIVVGQFVPTMFVRMLALDDEVKAAYDLSSLRYVMHAAAPCPVSVKHAMMDWLGPVIHEYYSSTENLGATYITPQEWLERPGSVGKSVTGPIHICDADSGEELASGEAGLIYFELGPGRGFDYINEPEKTLQVKHPTQDNWCTPGDIGYVDDDGYLFLTDRKDFMIISGGVNIYPQIIEDILIAHPDVLDVAVIGIPNREFGEEVKAIIQPKSASYDPQELSSDLTAWCRERTSAINCPKSYQFVEELPRLPSGKLAKHDLRKRFGEGKAW